MSLQISDAPVSRKIKSVSSALITANNFLAQTGLGDSLINYVKGYLDHKTPTRSNTTRKQRSKAKVSFQSRNNNQLIGSTRPFKSTLFQAPVRMGYSLPPAHMGFCGTADRMADRDPIGSLKLKGACLLDLTASLYSANGGFLVHGVAQAGSSNIDRAFVLMDILQMDPRVENTASCYTFFKFRNLKLHYIPLVATNSNGTITTAFIDDIQSSLVYFAAPVSANTNAFQQAALTSQFSNTSPSWSTHTTNYLDRGSKLYPTVYSGSEDLGDMYQCALVVLSNGFSAVNGTAMNNNTLYNIGQFFLEYEIDFYDPTWSFGLQLESVDKGLPRQERIRLKDERVSRWIEGRQASLNISSSSHSLAMETGCNSSMHSISSTPVEGTRVASGINFSRR
jgi:hypothetical protein